MCKYGAASHRIYRNQTTTECCEWNVATNGKSNRYVKMISPATIVYSLACLFHTLYLSQHVCLSPEINDDFNTVAAHDRTFRITLFQAHHSICSVAPTGPYAKCCCRRAAVVVAAGFAKTLPYTGKRKPSTPSFCMYANIYSNNHIGCAQPRFSARPNHTHRTSRGHLRLHYYREYFRIYAHIDGTRGTNDVYATMSARKSAERLLGTKCFVLRNEPYI